jgi:hypothetical protein
MRWFRISVLALLLSCLSGCLSDQNVSGNAYGGVIPWFGTNEHEVYRLADTHCEKFGKHAKVTSLEERAGGNAIFECIQ